MLAKPDCGHLPSGSRWAYEHKLDGYRCCLRVVLDGTTVLTSRNDKDMTAEFAELSTALGGEALALAGEVVVYNEHGQVDLSFCSSAVASSSVCRPRPVFRRASSPSMSCNSVARCCWISRTRCGAGC